MAKRHKHTRPDNPLTDKVVEDIEIKVNTLLRKFKDFGNGEKHDHRRHDIHMRLVGAVMKAYEKFVDNDRCSFESFADRFIAFEARHYVRDNIRVVREENATVSCDRRIDASDDESPSYVDGFADPRDRFEEGLLKFDIDIVAELLRRKNPVYATIFSLRRQGYSLAEIYPMLGIPKWELYDIMWPAVKDAVRRIYDL